ncbi:MAG TPA: rhomboid family intramembrane serine protease [Methylomirabilota bacterium]|nr:rhomboid family intramembrane serine protease [Methylomirabilota bacterium]
MRIIGHLPNEATATRFSDFLYVQGISNVVEPEKDVWAVWVHSEDELARAKELLTSFLGNPNDPRFQKVARRAREQRDREAADQARWEKRQIDRRQVFRATMPYGPGPLTVFLIITSVAMTVVSLIAKDGSIESALMMSQHPTGLPEIKKGEVWRLVTPIFLHAHPLKNPFHILFNMLWLLDLGSMIEARQGTRRLLWLVLAIGAVSNLGQYFYAGPFFYGMSGVNYGLLGYVWMKGKFDPASGLALHPHTIIMMLIWFFLCFTPLIPGVANGTHAVGLAMGIAWGMLASLKNR